MTLRAQRDQRAGSPVGVTTPTGMPSIASDRRTSMTRAPSTRAMGRQRVVLKKSSRTFRQARPVALGGLSFVGPIGPTDPVIIFEPGRDIARPRRAVHRAA